MTVKELVDQLQEVCKPEDQVVILLEDGPDSDFGMLEPGSVCDISEAGGFVSGMRVIRAVPR